MTVRDLCVWAEANGAMDADLFYAEDAHRDDGYDTVALSEAALVRNANGALAVELAFNTDPWRSLMASKPAFTKDEIDMKEKS